MPHKVFRLRFVDVRRRGFAMSVDDALNLMRTPAVAARLDAREKRLSIIQDKLANDSNLGAAAKKLHVEAANLRAMSASREELQNAIKVSFHLIL